MWRGIVRVAPVTAACLWLTACVSPNGGAVMSVANDATGSVPPAAAPASAPADPKPAAAPPTPSGEAGRSDAVGLGKRHFRSGDYALAEQHFRRATEATPADPEAWIGLAASYDRLKRFELADRAYEQAGKLAGPTAALLNNQGFSYMLRGDFKRAYDSLKAARAKDPGNPHIRANLELLQASARSAKSAR